MNKEIERKFLVKNKDWEEGSKPEYCRQGYLSLTRERIVRVRTIGNRGFLTIKGEAAGLSRAEFEYEIPYPEAEEILETLCEKPLIEKERSKVICGDFVWDVDKFMGDNEGLIIAEIELENEQQIPEVPEWIGQEVTGDPRFYNSNLVKTPYKKFQIKKNTN